MQVPQGKHNTRFLCNPTDCDLNAFPWIDDRKSFGPELDHVVQKYLSLQTRWHLSLSKQCIFEVKMSWPQERPMETAVLLLRGLNEKKGMERKILLIKELWQIGFSVSPELENNLSKASAFGLPHLRHAFQHWIHPENPGDLISFWNVWHIFLKERLDSEKVTQTVSSICSPK